MYVRDQQCRKSKTVRWFSCDIYVCVHPCWCSFLCSFCGGFGQDILRQDDASFVDNICGGLSPVCVHLLCLCCCPNFLHLEPYVLDAYPFRWGEHQLSSVVTSKSDLYKVCINSNKHSHISYKRIESLEYISNAGAKTILSHCCRVELSDQDFTSSRFWTNHLVWCELTPTCFEQY